MYTYLPEVQNDVIWTAVGSFEGAPAVWLVLINAVTFCVFGLDKWKARYRAQGGQTRRISERTLFLLAALGGSVGALLGMRVFRHKTLHTSFRVGIPAILAAQLLLLAGYWYFVMR
ncbi:MAG: DUF1294 domain-containing protein [Ruminococcaceae bacterium]|nr:DUF1294 domain-containing protein [Oscillospiraceae bacterium]